MEVKTLNEIRIKGFRVLVKNLGPADKNPVHPELYSR